MSKPHENIRVYEMLSGRWACFIPAVDANGPSKHTAISHALEELNACRSAVEQLLRAAETEKVKG